MAVISGQPAAPTEIERALVPAIYAAQLVQLAGRWGVASPTLLEGTGIAASALDDEEHKLPALAMGKLAERAIALTREPGLGFYFGLHLKLPSHGAVGLAAMTSATLRDALTIAERYVGLRTPHLTFRRYEEGDQAVLELVDVLPQGALRIFVTEALFTALVSMARAVLGRNVQAMFEMAFAEPRHFQGFAHLLPGAVRFAQPQNRVLFARGMLDESLQMADPVSARQAISRCERELASLGEVSSLLSVVRTQMRSRAQGFPSLDEVAEMQALSPRTLKRKLAAHGTSFQQLLDELRRDRAIALLEEPDLPLERIAQALGYSDPSNFNRAFRRWMGSSPSAFRAAHVSSKRG